MLSVTHHAFKNQVSRLSQSQFSHTSWQEGHRNSVIVNAQFC